MRRCHYYAPTRMAIKSGTKMKEYLLPLSPSTLMALLLLLSNKGFDNCLGTR